MKTGYKLSLFVFMLLLLLTAFSIPDDDISLAEFAPVNHHYSEAESCLSCKTDEAGIMSRVVGITNANEAKAALSLDSRGWLAGVHSRSQDHAERVDTACAWCHSPLTKGAVRDEKLGKPIPKGEWQGVSCRACHPKPGESKPELYGNFHPGKDIEQKENYQFRDMSIGTEANKLCTFCHHEYHDFNVEAKTAMLKEGTLRCIDCHMAGYNKLEKGLVERIHSLKVEASIPHSCSGKIGTSVGCHPGKDAEWMLANVGAVKGPRKTW